MNFRLGKKVVVAGCVSQGAPDTKFIAGLSVVGVQQIDRFLNYIAIIYIFIIYIVIIYIFIICIIIIL